MECWMDCLLELDIGDDDDDDGWLAPSAVKMEKRSLFPCTHNFALDKSNITTEITNLIFLIGRLYALKCMNDGIDDGIDDGVVN